MRSGVPTIVRMTPAAIRRGAGGLLFVLACAALPGQTVHLDWEPVASRKMKVIVRVRDSEGRILGEQVVRTSPAGDAVTLPDIVAASGSLDLSTPVHAPCTVQTGVGSHCVMRALTVVDFFGKGSGGVWIRGPERHSFGVLQPIPPGWGEAGYAVGTGRQDFVVWPSGGPARLLLGMTAAEVIPISPESGPSRLRGAVRDSDGSEFRRPFTIQAERLPARHPNATRRAAWVDFYEADRVRYLSGGAFEISPLPDEAMTFTLLPEGRVPIRFGAPRRSGGDLVDIGELRASRGSRLTIGLSHQSDLIGKGETFDVEARARRAQPGTDAPGEFLTGRLSASRPLVLDRLAPGEWNVALIFKRVRLGAVSAAVADPEEKLELRLTDETVAGRVTSQRGDPLEGVTVGIQFPPRATTTTSEDGAFLLTFPFAGGDVDVSAHREGPSLPQFRTVDPRGADAGGIEFQLPENEIALRVMTAKDERPISGASVEATIYPAETPGVSRLTYPTASDGSARIRSIPDGRVEFVVRAKGFADDGPRNVTLSESHPLEEIEVRLKRSGRIQGIVTYPNGAPVPGAHVAGPLSGSWEFPVPDVTAGTDGRFELDVPPDSRAVIVGWAPGMRLSFADVSADQTDVTLPLAPTAPSTRTRVTRADGSSFERATWTLALGNLVVDEITLAKAFRIIGCGASTTLSPEMGFDGCLMPGRYVVVVTDYGASQRRIYVSSPFAVGEGALERINVEPRTR